MKAACTQFLLRMNMFKQNAMELHRFLGPAQWWEMSHDEASISGGLPIGLFPTRLSPIRLFLFRLCLHRCSPFAYLRSASDFPIQSQFPP